jgi:hypothetical protein
VSARAGWYPDPAGRPGHYRWWDGSAWTQYLTIDPAATPPDQVDPAEVSGPAGQSEQTAGPRHAQQSDPAAVAAEDPQPAALHRSRGVLPPGYERPTRSPERPRPSSVKAALLSVGIAVVVAAIVLAIVVLGEPTAPTLTPPEPVNATESVAPSAAPTALPSFDRSSRKFEMNGLRLTLPAAPYTLTQLDVAALGSPGVDGDATVHKDYDGKGNSWYATVMAGQVDSNLSGANINQTADKIMSMLVSSTFGDSKITVKNQRKSTLTKNLPRPARIVTADLHYKVHGLHSSYDHFSLLVVKGSSGGYMAFVSSRPNDASPKIKKAIQDSINTIAVI